MTLWTVAGAAALIAAVVVGWKLRQALAMARFIGDATAQLEGMLPQLQRDAAAFEERWRQAWREPDMEGLTAYFGGPPAPEVAALYADDALAPVEEVALDGGLTVRNFFPASVGWTVVQIGEDRRRPGEYPFAHDMDGRCYVVDWAHGGPVWRIAEDPGDETREQVADALAAFLALPRTPLAKRV